KPSFRATMLRVLIHGGIPSMANPAEPAAPLWRLQSVFGKAAEKFQAPRRSRFRAISSASMNAK
ncbi:MAG: hypothetical protein ACREIP_11480, partial [Alphaproteobacteria bacterium]